MVEEETEPIVTESPPTTFTYTYIESENDYKATGGLIAVTVIVWIAIALITVYLVYKYYKER